MIRRIIQRTYNYGLFHIVLVVCLSGCDARLKKSRDGISPIANTIVGKHEKNTLLSSGISKKYATSFLLLNNLGIEYVDVPVAIDAYDFQKRFCSDIMTHDSQLSSQLSAGQIAYKSCKSIEDLDAFYTCHMERFDWQLQNYFGGQELFLVFAKPDRVCAVSIRPYKKYVEVVISIAHSC